jgi:hypothetical protein
MSFREHPLLLRQGFIKLGPNNIFLPSENAEQLHFLSLYQTQILLETALHFRYSKIVSSRAEERDLDMSHYLNLYKYQKNERRGKKRQLRSRRLYRKGGCNRAVTWEANQARGAVQRFLKNSLYQQLLQELLITATQLYALSLQVREPIRRLLTIPPRWIEWFRRSFRNARKEKHFVNTVNQVILLHYYKSASLFADHFGRELEKVHKKVH